MSFLMCYCLKVLISAVFEKCVTDGRTDGRTDRRTDKASYRDAWTHLKTKLTIILSPFIKLEARNKRLDHEHQFVGAAERERGDISLIFSLAFSLFPGRVQYRRRRSHTICHQSTSIQKRDFFSLSGYFDRSPIQSVRV